MAEITAKLIQELREKTAAGMMDCKKALIIYCNLREGINHIAERNQSIYCCR